MIYHLLYWWFDPDVTGRHFAYENSIFRATLAIMTSFVLVVLFAPRVIRFLLRKKIGDLPEFDNDKINELMRDKINTPTMGGVLIVAALLGTTLLWARLDNFYVQMGVVCVVGLTLVGGVDDWLKLTGGRRGGGRQGLYTLEKLLFQIGLSVVLAIYAYRYAGAEIALGNVWPRACNLLFYNPESPLVLPAVAFVGYAVIVLVGTSNAVNLTDGMDGLAAGCVGIVSFVFMILAFTAGLEKWADYLLTPKVPGSEELAILCGAMMGACLGFLWFNCYPVTVFMGDTGSLPLGGLIGYVAVVTRNELMLLIVGGIFVMEALSVLIQVGYFKMTGGKRVFRIAPIHHHFQAGGWSEPQTVVRLWLLGVVFAAMALVVIKLR